MKLKGMFTALMLSVIVTAGCGNGEDSGDEMTDDHSSEDEMRTLDVTLEVPETASADDAVEFTAHVHSDGEDVTDADSVVFEVMEGEESLDMIDAEHSENGIYSIEYDFDEPGTYTVISHVDAFQLHTMPEAEITVE